MKRAAITAIGLVGDASMAKPLVLLSESVSDDDQRGLSEALARLRGTGVDAALVEALHDSPAAAQRTIIRALAARSARTAVSPAASGATVPALLSASSARRAAWTWPVSCAGAHRCRSSC